MSTFSVYTPAFTFSVHTCMQPLPECAQGQRKHLLSYLLILAYRFPAAK